MEENIQELISTIEELYNQEKFDEIIALLTDKELKKQKNAELYLWKGLAWYKKKDYDYDEAIKYYDEAIELNNEYELAFYNRGLAKFAKRIYTDAINDYTIALSLNQEKNKEHESHYYTDRGRAKEANEECPEAIEDYSKAIQTNKDPENGYYYRGLAYYKKALKEEKDYTDLLNKSQKDFEKYLELIQLIKDKDENDNGEKYAKEYIEELKAVINDQNLLDIKLLVNEIKNLLLINKDYVSHYTTLSTLKSLILDGGKFRISEGNFLNDPSEGTEIFHFLDSTIDNSRKFNTSAETFYSKPFIGSFVIEKNHDDLNMWRFYGKEEGEEAKGCSITLQMQDFIENIKNAISNEKNKEARLADESDINIYQVAYLLHGKNSFVIPNETAKSKKLTNLMQRLKDKINRLKEDNSIFLEEYLNSIAFLFKRYDYIIENEVRLVIKGIEFPKRYNMEVTPPKVYIEFESIKDIVSQITLGPKVDKVNEWASAFHYSYEDNAPKIMISHLPFK